MKSIQPINKECNNSTPSSMQRGTLGQRSNPREVQNIDVNIEKYIRIPTGFYI